MTSADIYTPQKHPDCASLGTQQAATSLYDTTSVSFNFGLEASARFSGQAGLNIQVSSVGFSTQRVEPQFSVFYVGNLPAMVFGSILPFSISPSLGLDAAANVTAQLPPFSMGASATVNVDLGGSVSLPSMWTGTTANYVTNTPTIGSFHSISTTFSNRPFTIGASASSSPNAWGGSVSVSLIPWYELDLFSVLPITSSPIFTVGASLWTQGTKPPMRLLRDKNDRVLGGRALSTCVEADAVANTGLDISVGSTVVNDIVPAISSILASLVPSSFRYMPVTTGDSIFSASAIGSQFKIATPPCPSASSSPSSSPTPSPTPSPSVGATLSPSPSHSVGAVLSSSSSTTTSTPFNLSFGAMIGIAAGVGVIVSLCVGLVLYMTVCRKTAKPEPPTIITSGGLTVRSVAQ